MNTFIKLIPALALAALIPVSLQARSTTSAPYADGPKMTVRFGDLNLTRSHDVEVLYRRIRSAARLVCTDANSSAWGDNHIKNWIKCFNGTTEDAVLRVNRPMLTALHHERTRPRVG
jgi:UrcA family protein